jgi:hypothetical protein
MPEQPRDRPALDSATGLSGFPDAVASRMFGSNQILPRFLELPHHPNHKKIGKEQMVRVQMPGKNSVRAKKLSGATLFHLFS